MNKTINLKFEKLNDLCDQIFDYFHLAYYDLETKFDHEISIDGMKSKFKTFADKHFKSAIKEFENEIQYIKNKSPQELINLENISSEINYYFNQLLSYNIFDIKVLLKLKLKTKEILNKI